MMKKLLVGTALGLAMATLAFGAQAHDRRGDRDCSFEGHHRSAHHVRGHRHKLSYRAHSRTAKVVKTRGEKGMMAKGGKAKAGKDKDGDAK